ncbi:hypothetical protein AKH17_01240 [Pelagibacteraceae bacterium GOM-A2]|nr:hypothetical protein AKH17_01240 [Pelagibacteraceae bacterium GOM-A2]
MIIKQYELKKINLNNYRIYLFYGKNDGLKNDIINISFLKEFKGNLHKYDESEFIYNSEIIITELLNRSLFESEKIIIISRVTDKIKNIIEELNDKDLTDVKIILKSGILEKRSKLRIFCEKDKKIATIPLYEDNNINLTTVVTEFINKHKINLSRESINLLVSRASGDRGNLKNELDKILNYSISNKKIELSTIKKLSNLAEDYGVNELADHYLCKNKSSIFKILNENNFSDDDCMLILRTILSKSKRLLNFLEKFEISKNIDDVISGSKPPIFWKDKENVKKQIKSWNKDDLKNKIYKINEIETTIKENSKNSLNIVSDFIVNY